MKAALCLLLALAGSALAYKSYSGYQVLQTKVLSHEETARLAPLMNRPEFYFTINPAPGRAASIMVSPENFALASTTLNRMRLSPKVIVEDVGVIVESERSELQQLRVAEKKEGRAPALDRFLTFEEVEAYVNEVAAAFPSLVTVENIGSSTEGRTLWVVKLSNGAGKKGIFVESGIHGREWLGVPAALNALNELTENLAANQALLDANDWYFLLVANPDGYSFSFTDDRFWRKTRSPNAGSTCLGTDPNRNFDISWGTEGTTDACSDTFAGAAAYSEPESKALADFLAATPNLAAFITFHSFGGFLTYPYGYTTDLPANAQQLDDIAQAANSAIQAVNGFQYTVGPFASTVYFSYGASRDYAYDTVGIPLVFQFELPGGGPNGFDPPASLIAPTVAEVWEGVKVIAASA
ncbi:carboxypeptidase B-like [Neocloeon triangulifer]|uniref:carboxypeptidase B-like n=1 Tax=Neocloeon triangulifer TaxID=2078957 RepID=UPI00286F5DF1|nr:carboxypeptidase B-like [Neocloeon triangulifer]